MRSTSSLVTAGLSRHEAEVRLAQDGPNELPSGHGRPLAVQFAAELMHFFAIMLWAAAVLAWVAGLPELALAIAAVVVLNASFAFVQERRSERAAQSLSALLPRSVNVRRDGQPTAVEARTVVMGDVLLLAAGDRVCADADAIVDHGVRLDTSMLTGESEAVALGPTGRLLAGTFLVDGEAEAVVVATGGATRLAEISTLTSTTRRPQRPLTAELNRVVRTISVVAVGVGLTFLVVSLLIGTSREDAVIFAIGVTVALVPEGLLPTVTLSLAIGAQRMVRDNALVRHLDAVETLGSTTFICTDKTGTLTQNRMVVVEVWTPTTGASIAGDGYGPAATVDLHGDDDGAVGRLMRVAARCGSGRAVDRDGEWVSFGDPMEAALDAAARRCSIDIDTDRQERAELSRFPFSAGRRRMSVVLAATAAGEPAEVVVKGAAETVLACCRDGDLVRRGAAAAAALTDRGLRVLAVASRVIGPTDSAPGDAVTAEQDLTLLGLVGLVDPPRPAARDALQRCRRAGIKVAMITGDHPRTAAAIGDAVGLRRPGIAVIEASDLPSDQIALGELIDHDGIIVSRATPEDKLRIATALRGRGHVVAMTGDGVNDGPAMRAANIGVAMGRSGTDVAREAADLVLLDDDFATIVDAVAQGRATFLNVRRFLTYHLTDNVAELTPYLCWALSGGRFPLALGVMQILALDIGTDTMSATALGAEPPTPTVLDGPPVAGRLLNRTVAWRAFGLLGPAEACISMMAFVTAFLAAGWRPGDPFPDGTALTGAAGAAFLAVVFGQKANAWACRSATEPPWRLDWSSNRLLMGAAVAELVFVVVCIAIAPVAGLLDQRVPPWQALLVAVAAAPAVWSVDAAFKRRRRGRRVAGTRT